MSNPRKSVAGNKRERNTSGAASGPHSFFLRDYVGVM